eukprot:15349984-Ditylum_brightwellii.AAC.1
MEMPWTHYKVNLLTGCTWVNPNTDWPTHNRYKIVGQNAQKKDGVPKSKVITRGSLCPITGDFKCRLNASFSHLPLIPTVTNKNTESKACQLHCWAAWEEVQGTNKPAGYRNGIVCCKQCNVHRSIPCISIFHEVEDLQSST